MPLIASTRLSKPSRRAVVRGMAAGAGAVALGGTGGCGDEASPEPPALSLTGQMADDVAWMVGASNAEILQRAAQRLQAGATANDLFGALLLAGVQEFAQDTEQDSGGRVHGLFASNAVFSSFAGRKDELLALFAALDMFKILQLAVRNERPASLRFASPLDESRLPPVAMAGAQLGAAILALDARAAEHAAAAMVRAGAVDAAFSDLFLHGGRDLGAAHNIIFADHAARIVSNHGHAALIEPMMRSLARSLTRQVKCEPGQPRCVAADTSVFEENRALAGTLPAGWADGKPEIPSSRKLTAELRTADQAGAARLVHAALVGGLAVDDVWDAMTIYAAEHVLSESAVQQGLRGVHAFTTTLAFRNAFAASSSEPLRRWLVVQAASSVVRYRPSGLNSGVPYPTIAGSGPTPTWEELEPIAATSVDDVLSAVATDPLIAARMALGLGRAPGMTDALVRRMFELALIKGDRPDRAHDFKLHEALVGHAALVSDDARPLIVALCVSGARPPTAAPWERFEEAQALVAALAG